MAVTSSATDAGSLNYSRQDYAIALALGKLRNSLIATALATNYSEEARNQGSRFGGSVRIPEVGKHTVQDKAPQTKITPKQVALSKNDIAIDQHKVVDFVVESAAALVVGNEKLTLSRTLENAVLDIADSVESFVLGKYVSAGNTINTSLAGKKLLRDVRKQVIKSKFNLAADTFAIWGAEAEYGFLDVDNFVKVNEAGSSEALRNAALGKLFGLNNYTHNNVPLVSGSPEKEVGLVFQREGLGVAFVDMDSADLPQEFKENGAFANTMTLEDDFGNSIYTMRMVSQYDQDYMGTRIQVDTQFGADIVREELVIAVLLALTGGPN